MIGYTSSLISPSCLPITDGVSIQVLGTDFTAMIGHNFSVPISVDGNPTPTVQWTHNGVVIESTARLRADINGLFLTPSTFDDFGDYVVTATNNISSVNATFSVGISGKYYPAKACIYTCILGQLHT